MTEVCSIEIALDQLNIEVSVNTAPGIRFNNIENKNSMTGFNVYLTARDKALRRVWRTPIIDSDGKPKSYNSIEEAIADAEGKLLEKITEQH